jgi:hypothetical protein
MEVESRRACSCSMSAMRISSVGSFFTGATVLESKCTLHISLTDLSWPVYCIRASEDDEQNERVLVNAIYCALCIEASEDLLAVWHQGALDLDVARELLERDLGVRTCAVSVRCVRPSITGGRTRDDVPARLMDALASKLVLCKMRSIASAPSWIASELPLATRINCILRVRGVPEVHSMDMQCW